MPSKNLNKISMLFFKSFTTYNKYHNFPSYKTMSLVTGSRMKPESQFTRKQGNSLYSTEKYFPFY